VEKKTVRCRKKEIVTMGRDANKDTVKYPLRRGGKVVYKGKTDNPERRAKEPTQQGKRFTIPTTSFEVCRSTTSKREKPGIDIDKKVRGKRPLYNKKL
jgi:hypothetical protein